MPKYSIQGIVSADKHLGVIEASNAKEAIEKAWGELDTGTPNVCHQCSREMNIGDVYQLCAQNVDDDADYAESE